MKTICVILISLCLVGCLPGYHLVPMREAWDEEVGVCNYKRDRAPAEDKSEVERKCMAMAGRKWSNYWNEGKRYPDTQRDYRQLHYGGNPR